jgi:hypothetical protein
MHAFFALAFTAMLAVTQVAPALSQVGHIILKPLGASCM